jgi:hypothetical protein
MNCPALLCPELPCTEDQQFTVTEGCCKYCKGDINIMPELMPDYDNTNSDNSLEVKPER